ncbi:hypothetical protein EDD18DRAFT_1112033 [Armillaria luteobubalina]|uniref:MFS general substrate transporter n=1 Tax=Armillaria luteobubalina TaxID=153913 RepID=A0AA39PI12_9AGAR|nr:hypothetical protein EDD18DRAFT_1112033 [Armillaria luteobubalina]
MPSRLKDPYILKRTCCSGTCPARGVEISAWLSTSYTFEERRNMAFYVGGIMFYKLGLEFFNGSITTLGTDRFAQADTFTNVSVLFFSLMTTVLLVVDAATGGKMRGSASSPTHYGSWNPNAIFIIWTLSGVAYGMVELIRRIIPCDIVGGDVGKLRRMDATVHVFYEVTSTAAAFVSPAAISRFGNNYSFFLSPVFFALAGVVWFYVSVLNHSPYDEQEVYGLDEVDRPKRSKNYLIQVGRGIAGFGESIWVGTMMGWFLDSKLSVYIPDSGGFFRTLLLLPLRNVLWELAPGVIVGGSDFGELLGALTVFLLSDVVTTPFNIVWILPYFTTVTGHSVDWAWRLAGLFIPISMSWAAGDVSLSAYIQAALSTGDASLAEKYPAVSHLGAVMGYVTPHAILTLCGVSQATFIPKGAFSINPKMINGVRHDGFDHQEDESLKNFSEMQTRKDDESASAVTV